jgi:hypothetical protein
MTIKKYLLTIFITLSLSSPVYAVNGQWTTAASGCVPDESTLGKYEADGGELKFLPGKTGEIIFRCNITDPADFGNFAAPIWNNMKVTFKDADGFGNDSRVFVLLRRVGILGNTATVGGATFDSNSFAFNAAPQSQVDFFFHPFDFINTAYFLEIHLLRSNAAFDTRIHRVHLS